MVNVAAIFSTLGNPNSLIPLAVKDMSATAGMTSVSFVTGKEEGEDRFIDEVGTQIIWLLGIPAFKWLFDKTVFKAFGYDSKFDVRNLKNSNIFEKIKEYAPTKEVKKSIEKIGKKPAVFKNLALWKFFISTGATVGSYIGLTRAKQAYTEKKIRQNLIDEYNRSQNNIDKSKKTDTKNSVSFKGVGDIVKNFAFSPVKNMWILDGAITGERLADSRSPQEFVGYAIKEGATLCFMYYAGEKIQEMLEKWAHKKHNKSIGLDARVLEGKDLAKSFNDGSIQNHLNSIKEVMGDAVKLYEFLHKNPENEVVKAAKQSDIISMYKKTQKWYNIFKKAEYTDKIDTRKFIDLDKVRGIYDKIETLHNQYIEALKKGETTEQFFSKVKKLKRGSIITNIGTCIFALGVVTPAVMLAKRFSKKDDIEFQTKSEIRKQLIEEGIIK